MSAEDSEGNGNAKTGNDSPQPALHSGDTSSNPAREEQQPAKRFRVWKDSQWWQVLIQLILIPVGIYALYVYSGQLDEMRKSTDAATRAANSAEQSLALTRDNLALTAKSVELTQKSTELSQKTIDLTQKSLEATQQALGYASKANDISQQGMEAANTPWVDVAITTVKRVADNWIEIGYTIENYSGSPATRMFAQCFLENTRGISEDISSLSDSTFAIMPHQKVSSRSRILTENGQSKVLVNQINEGKVGIKIAVMASSATGKRNSFIETFYKIQGTFTVTNTQFNPSEEDILKLIRASIYGTQPKKK